MLPFRDYFARKTFKIRNRIVKYLRPNLAASMEQLRIVHYYIGKTPRPMILFAKKHFAERQPLRGIEIGVGNGDNASSIFEELSVDRLFLIDPYTPYEDALEGERVCYSDCSNWCTIAHDRLREYHQVVWLQNASEFAIRDFKKENDIDFVYIDGNHSYEYVKNDISLYYPLVKDGGLIGGHDYIPFYGTVVRAVNEFVDERKLELRSVFPDWWIVKHE